MKEHFTGNRVSDDTMELLSHLYSFMDEETKANWSLHEAELMIQDQHTYEIEHGQEPKVYDVHEVYEIIREFIEQDAEEEDC